MWITIDFTESLIECVYSIIAFGYSSNLLSEQGNKHFVTDLTYDWISDRVSASSKFSGVRDPWVKIFKGPMKISGVPRVPMKKSSVRRNFSY